MNISELQDEPRHFAADCELQQSRMNQLLLAWPKKRNWRLLAASVLLVLGLSASAIGAAAVADAALTPAKVTGVQLRPSYATARARLIGSGWTTDSTWGTSGVHGVRAYPRCPEVLCGEGYDAVCTGRFKKDGIAILVSINPRSRALQVTPVDED